MTWRASARTLRPALYWGLLAKTIGVWGDPNKRGEGTGDEEVNDEIQTVGLAAQTVGQRIIAARNELGMRQIDLVELVGVSERSIQAYENDEVVPYRKMNDLSRVLGKSVPWLLYGEKDEQVQVPGEKIIALLEEVLAEVRSIKTAEKKPAPRRK